eukprot:CAMPEP_0119550152 /NCGR_PEP_ID=MMETSP1352-20130426/3722_1 /TAXON_ID=265584 /ORGANISM="Stauroneis constricta, Strain CCMP1120" /LENGTH=480 /DNA_ID=CAMNT_0007595909 /DNA_START=95 /DNA_END=1534 /DNA_ORIENTATION=-
MAETAQRPRATSLLGKASSLHKSSHDEFTSVTVRKDSNADGGDGAKKQKVGIKLVLEENGRVRVSAIAKNGLFADSDIAIGDTLLSVNGKRLRPGEGAEVLMSVITNARQTVTCVVKKTSSGSAASKSTAKPKAKSLYKNNQQQDGNDNHVITKQRYRGMAKFKVDGSLEFGKPTIPENQEQITITAVKDEHDDDVGVAFVVTPDRKLRIQSIAKDSHFNYLDSETEKLQVDDHIVSINDMNFLQYPDATYASKILQKAKRHVTLVIQRDSTGGGAGGDATAKSRKKKSSTAKTTKKKKALSLPPVSTKTEASASTNSTATSSDDDDDDDDSIGSFHDPSNHTPTTTTNTNTDNTTDNNIMTAVANSTTRIQRLGISAPKLFEKQLVGIRVSITKKNSIKRLVVNEIHPKSIFQGTSLQVGDIILSINNISYELKPNVKRAQQTLHDAKENVVLVVEKRHTDFHLNSSFTMDGSSRDLVW